ncbi:MAG TPA: ABATE domain-containing protein [Pseudonocardiaceae bacterium]|nr:ABATE domain-containing protein [Pseudonocardiaceae bacterium]
MEHAFPCGNAALDFVGTLRARRNAVPLEKLRAPKNLDAWFRESGVGEVEPVSAQVDLDKAIALREAIYDLVSSRLAREDYDERALALLNDAARMPATVPQLSKDGKHIRATADQALSAVARDAVEILGGPDGALLKECNRPECTQVFIDRSRGFRREWCAMKTCGNRVKGATYRARQRGNIPMAGSARP